MVGKSSDNSYWPDVEEKMGWPSRIILVGPTLSKYRLANHCKMKLDRCWLMVGRLTDHNPTLLPKAYVGPTYCASRGGPMANPMGNTFRGLE